MLGSKSLLRSVADFILRKFKVAGSVWLKIEKAADSVWQKYKVVKPGQFKVIRSGFVICGAADEPEAGSSRAESDLEHVAGLCYLAILFSEFFPKIVPIRKLSQCFFWAMFHEIGEIEIGDIPDDGKRDSALKDQAERNVLVQFLDGFKPSLYCRILNIFDSFQGKKKFGKTVFFLDKLEAVLMAFSYEASGRVGKRDAESLMRREMSENDKKLIEITGSDKIADTWGCNLILRARKYNFEYINEFIEIIQAAAIDVRGEPLDWIQNALEYDYSSLTL